MTEHEQKDRSFSTEKLKQIGPGFVERVSKATLDSLLFKLHQCGAITSAEEEYIGAANQRSEKAKRLFDTVTKKGVSSLLMKNLKDEDPFLYQELCLM
uniref:CARD domain-containing protein n=1 Tax=Oryzias melastigma TaxID=30732 RepID=A0A3B3BCR3_ORYME